MQKRKALKVPVSNRYRLFFCFASIIIVILLTMAASGCPIIYNARSEALDSYTLRGQVIDSVIGEPITNVTVAVWETTLIREGRQWKEVFTLKTVTQTEGNGSYKFTFQDRVQGNIYAYYDDPTSPGYDYLPAFQSINWYQMEREANITFGLVPSASIIFEGDLLFVDSSSPPESYSFSVVPEKELPHLAGSVLTYGTSANSQSRFIDLHPNHIIVPANTALRIELKAVTQTDHTLGIDEINFSHLGKGEKVHIEIGSYFLPYNLGLTSDAVMQAEKTIDEIEQKEFYVEAEKRDLEKASNLVESAKEEIVLGFYKEGYADLREAYTKAIYIKEKIQLMSIDAAVSTYVIVVFLALTSMALSSFLFEQWVRKAFGTGLFYVLFLALFFYVYAGCRLVETSSFLVTAGLAISASILSAFILSHLFSLEIFSMAKRNLQRRRTRFLLTLITVSALVMGFVVFTSFSTEFGFTSTMVRTTKLQAEGLLVRQPLPDIPSIREPSTYVVFTFTPLETSVINWLQKKPEVIMVAPKVENYPHREALASLSTSMGSLSTFGVLGISPSAEVETTGFDKLLVQGRYLLDDEEDAILISVQAAAILNVHVGDRLVLRTEISSIEVTLVGLLDDYAFSRLPDLDGLPMMPKKLFMRVEGGVVREARIEPCEPSEVVVTNLQTALKLQSFLLIDVSRINGLVAESVDLFPFSRQIALERDYWVWTVVGGNVNLMGLTYYPEIKGLAIFVPWFIAILNVVITMITAIYERRREVVVLSSVGLNPTHITILFGAEALITGVVGGGIGYLLGLSGYKLMALLSVDLFVRQKVSAVWSLASLGIAVTAVLVGAFLALRFSVVITPSLMRRWKADGKLQEGEWVFEIPIRVPPEEVKLLLDYIWNRLQRYDVPRNNIRIYRIKQVGSESAEATRNSLSFTYQGGSGMGAFLSRNEIIVSKGKRDATNSLRLICKTGIEDHAIQIASFMRRLVLEWSAMKEE